MIRVAHVVAILTLSAALAPAAQRNAWYWDSPVNIHWDNHSRPLGQGMSVDEITRLFAGLKVDMIQVSARSGHTTYPSKIGVPNPKLDGYDTMATWREVTRRLGTRMWVYINVIDTPHLIEKHPDWRCTDAKGNHRRICNRPSRDGSGWLEAMMIPLIREIIDRYHPDGFWFDGDWQIPPVCYCPNCKAAWKEATGQEEPPADSSSPDWEAWVRLEHRRLDEYKRKLAEAIHKADPNCTCVSNWSWAISQRDPRTAPPWADVLTGDVGAGSSRNALYALRLASLMLSAQEHTPHDVMSAIYPKRIRSLPRMLQEGGLVMAGGASWFLWVNRLTPDQFDHLRTCYGLVDARRDALGRTHSANPVAVLLSESSWRRGLAHSDDYDHNSPRDLAFALQDACYGVDVVNEQTLREQIARWGVVVVANQRQVAPETLAALREFVNRGGTLIVTDGGLRPGEEDSAEVVELLGVARTPQNPLRPRGLAIGDRTVPLRANWKVEPRGAKVLARLAGNDEPLLTVRSLGKGRVAYLAAAGWPYPDEDGLAIWAMKRLGIGPMVEVSGSARSSHLVFSARRRGTNQLVLHASDLTTYADGKRIEPNSSHAIDPLRPIPEIDLRMAVAAKPKTARVVPATTRIEWQYEKGALVLKLRDFQTHAAILLETEPPPAAELLPAGAQSATPLRYTTQPVILSEDFQQCRRGKFPEHPVWAANVDAPTDIRVAQDPHSADNRVLEFVDAPDARAGFVPYLLLQPGRLDRGRAKLSTDILLEPESRVQIEMRDGSAGRLVAGPSVRITEAGHLQAGGKTLATVPQGRWFRLELEFGLGIDAPVYHLTIIESGKPPQRFADLPYANRAFSRCTWLGILSHATRETRFYIDNIRLERLPKAPAAGPEQRAKTDPSTVPNEE